MSFIGNQAHEIRDTLEALADSRTGINLGLKIPSHIHDVIIQNAEELHERTLTSQPYVTNGKDLHDAFIETAGHKVVETLHGEHKEVALVIDVREDQQALDRREVAYRYDGMLQTFYVNLHGIKFAADVLYKDNSDQADLETMAALYYNLAAAAVLADSSLRLLVVS